MKICLHAGMHKTGTTSLQEALTAQTATLAEHGVLAYVNPPQLLVKVTSSFDPAWIRRQVDTAERAGYSTLLFSSEAISILGREQMQRLLAAFDGRPVRVVLALRHWSGYLPSRWKQNCVRHDTQSFPAYLDALYSAGERHIDSNYAQVVDSMRADGRTDLRVISYDNARRADDLQYQLLTALGLSDDTAAHIAARTPLRHQSADTDFYELCRLFNGAWSARTGRERNALFNGIGDQRTVRGLDNFYYGFGRAVTNLRRRRHEVIHALLERIDCSRRIVRVDRAFAQAWQARAQIAFPYLQNPQDGRLFPDLDEPRSRFADLEVPDLSQSLRRRMVSCIEEADA